MRPRRSGRTARRRRSSTRRRPPSAWACRSRTSTSAAAASSSVRGTGSWRTGRARPVGAPRSCSPRRLPPHALGPGAQTLFGVEVVLVIFFPLGGHDLSREPRQLALTNSLTLPLLLLVLAAQTFDVVFLGLRGSPQVCVLDLVEPSQRLVGGELEEYLPTRHQVHPVGVLQRFVGMLLDDQR